MFKKTKLKQATRRIKHADARLTKGQSHNFLARMFGRIWDWLCCLNILEITNIILLIVIILLGIHIYDTFHTVKASNIVVVQAQKVPVVTVKKHNSPKDMPTLPIQRDAQTRKFITEPVNIVPAPAPILKPAQNNGIMYGDIIIDNRGDGRLIKSGAEIRGNLYLQNMHKFILPCDIKIHGNLFLRDLGLLQFCGDFEITGNIYVSPRSSFGPLPRTAKLGGQIIL